MMTDTPQHIRPPWARVAARMQSEARKTQGYAVITIEILVNADGNPVLWFEPGMRRIEPRRCNELAAFLSGVDERP